MRASMLRGEHSLAVPDGYLHVDEGEGAVLRRHELFPLHGEEEIEHPLVEHLPRPDLLLDHVEARALDVQLRVHRRSKIWRVARREGGCNYPTIRLA